jgi:hypothetical protein
MLKRAAVAFTGPAGARMFLPLKADDEPAGFHYTIAADPSTQALPMTNEEKTSVRLMPPGYVKP